MDHMSLFEDLNKAIQNRYEMIEAAAEAERQSQHMGRAIAERMDEMVEARAAEMTIDEASVIDSTESVSTKSTSTDEAEDDEWNWSENVLVGVMDKNGIKDRDAFIEFAKAYDIDGNRYLKGSELAAAAVDFAAQDGAEEEADSTEETPEETDPESSSDWSDGQDPWEGQ